MDAYVWYTINRESQDRFHTRLNEAEQWRLVQQVRAARMRRYDRVLLIIGERLIALGLRLQRHGRTARGQVP